jgi:RNA polymerase sigma factor (sigma-70 family)
LSFFEQFYPVAYEVANQKLGGTPHPQCEDIAMEALGAMVEMIPSLKSFAEIRPLLITIARNKTNDHLRQHLAQKRKADVVISIEGISQEEAASSKTAVNDFLDSLNFQDLNQVLMQLFQRIKKQHRVVLYDHFYEHLSHKEIAAKRGIAQASVGKFLQRGLLALKEAMTHTPHLQAELRESLCDNDVVQTLLPIARAGEMRHAASRAFTVSYAPPDESECKPSDGALLVRAEEALPERKLLSGTLKEKLSSLLSSNIQRSHP